MLYCSKNTRDRLFLPPTRRQQWEKEKDAAKSRLRTERQLLKTHHAQTDVIRQGLKLKEGLKGSAGSAVLGIQSIINTLMDAYLVESRSSEEEQQSDRL